jgi:hypothetical protein
MPSHGSSLDCTKRGLRDGGHRASVMHMRKALALSALLLAGTGLPVRGAASSEALQFQARSAGATAWLTQDALWLTYLDPGRLLRER